MNISPLTCSAEELFTIVSSPRPQFLRLCLANPAITPQHIILLLRNRSITAEIIESICETQGWISQHNVQLAVVNCVKTSHTLALRILQLLYWNDLVKVSANLRLSARLRRAAENHLRNKIPELSPGEKISLARTAPRSILSILAEETEPRIVTALLQNPHVIEEDVLMMVNNQVADPVVLLTVAREFRWSSSYQVRSALVRNSRTPLPLALSLLSKLTKQDLEFLRKAPATAELLRRAASRILDGQY